MFDREREKEREEARKTRNPAFFWTRKIQSTICCFFYQEENREAQRVDTRSPQQPKRHMTPATPPLSSVSSSSIEDSAWWASVLVILAVATVLGVNAVLLHANNRKANGRLVRPLLRIATGRRRARSLSTNMAEVHPAPPPEIFSRVTTTTTTMNSGSNDVWEAAARWVRWDPNASTRAMVQGWIDRGDEDSARR